MEPATETYIRDLSQHTPCAASSRRGVESSEVYAAQSLLEKHLIEFEEVLSSQLASSFSVVDSLAKSAAALQGKRLRPQLVFLGALATGAVSKTTFEVAAVVEMVHGATLVHDDVLDGASMRRHAPAAHVTWGTNPSILLGDVLFSKAYLLAASQSSPYAAQRVGQAGLALCEGELRQQSTIGRWDLSLDEYLDILRQKTGELCAASAALGAWSTAAPPTLVTALETYGRKLGMAFQVYDDWLDVWGSAATGKPIGNDLANLKPTLPTIWLMASTANERKPELLRRLSAGLLTDDLLLMLHECDASERTLAAARQLAQAATDALQPLPDSPAKSLLVKVAQASVRRDR